MRKMLILCLALLLAIAPSAGALSLNLWTATFDEGVPDWAQQETQELRDLVLQALESGDAEPLIPHLYRTIAEKPDDLKTIVRLIHDYGDAKYEPLFSCCVWFATTSDTSAQSVMEKVADPRWIVNLTPVEHDVFVDVMTLTSEQFTLAAAAVMAKQHGEWKLCGLSVGNYAIENMTAPELYAKAQSARNRGELFAAYTYALCINQTLRPCFGLISYNNGSEMAQFINDCVDAVNENYSFPIAIDTGNEIVQLYAVRLNGTDRLMMPQLSYTSDLPYNEDPDALKAEALRVAQAMAEQYDGYPLNFSYVLMSAFNEPPLDPQTQYPCYNTVLKDGVPLSKLPD